MKIKGLDQLVSDTVRQKESSTSDNESSKTITLIKNVYSTLNESYLDELIIFTSLINDDWSNEIPAETYLNVLALERKQYPTVQEMLHDYFMFDMDMFGERIPYQVIAKVTYEMDKLDLFTDNFLTQKDRLDYNLAYIKSNFENGEKVDSYIAKIISHFELSFAQCRFIRESVGDVTKQAKKASETLEEIKFTKGQIYAEFVSILGIFSALMFGLFGGFQGLAASIAIMADGFNLGKTIMASTAIMISITAFTYALVQWIGRIVDKPIISCGCKFDSECTHSFLKRNRTFIILTLIEILVFLMGMLIFIGKITGITDWFKTIESGWILFGSMAVIIAILFVWLIFMMTREPVQKNK